MTKANKEGRRKAPILRFKGFTDDWEQRKLNDIAKVYDGIHETPNYTTCGIPFVSVENIRTLTTKKYVSKSFYEEKFKIKPQYDDILMTRIGDIGTSNVVSKVPLAYYVSLALIRLNTEQNAYFFKYFFDSEYAQKELWSRTLHIAFPKKINKNEIGKINIYTTCIKEENKIAQLFNKLNSLLTLYEKKKQLLTQLKQGIVNFLITKNGQKSQLRFSGFNNNWESKSFEKLLNYEQPTKYIVKKADYISQGTPVLTANKSFILGYTNENNVYQNIPAIIFDDFTLESKYVDFPFMVKSSAIKILTSKNSNLFFIYQLLNNQRFVQEGHSRHYISVVQKKKVLVPSIQEQNKIGNLIKQLENNIEQNSDTIALLKSLKEFLLQNMFL